MSIFDKYPLNTSKYFDYLDFQKYYKRESSVTQELKNGMNTMRTEQQFNMLNTNHKIIGANRGGQLWRTCLVLSERQLGKNI